jgi:DNA uptake protein ComE-like DNA-binding protein
LRSDGRRGIQAEVLPHVFALVPRGEDDPGSAAAVGCLYSCTLAAVPRACDRPRMTIYTRRQLVLILLLTGAAGAGLGVDHWRHARPELAERLETLDRGERREVPPLPPRAPARRARPAPAGPLDVNQATEPELAGLPGLGRTLAARIVAARPFADVDELRRVKGMRRTTLERVRPFLTTGP